MKKNLLATTACLMIVIMAFVSCSKEGPAGATGPAGSTGAAGPAGPAGVPGAAGATGTANVIYSAWLDVAYKPDTFRVAGVLDTAGFFADVPAPKMTSAILTSGEIKVYINLNSATAPEVSPLPYFDVYSGISITPTFYLNNAGVGTINLYSNVNASTGTSNNVKVLQYRYILIPGMVTARVGSPSPVDWNNYSAVKAYLNLKD